MRAMSGWCAPIALGIALAAPAARADFVVSVAASANLWRAGGNGPALPGSNPSRVDLDPADAGETLRLLDVTGTTDCDGAGSQCEPSGPDGTIEGNAEAPAFGAIVGIAYRGADSLPLLGVLLGPDLAHAPADPQNFRFAEGYERFAPALGQPFWIGDGLAGTGEGAPHEIVIPDGATRLFLGFHAPTIASATGSLSVRVAVPEPAASPAAALLALRVLRRTRARFAKRRCSP